MKQIILNVFLSALVLTSLNSCNLEHSDAGKKEIVPRITRIVWGETDGKAVYLYTLTNKNGIQANISNYGGSITSWLVPDRKGKKANIVIGFDSLSGYLSKPPYFGALIGRYGNRIANGRFKIGNLSFKLATNNGKNHLHGGNKGFDKIVWDASTPGASDSSLTLHYVSVDGEEGYPGNLKVTVIYTLTEDNALTIEYNAETDKSTPVNLTNHSYFNLTGDPTNTILDHFLMIRADQYTPVDSTLIPTGEIKTVVGTPFDFSRPQKIGLRISQVKGGYDHNFVLNRKDNSLQPDAVLFDSMSGRKMEIYTTEPGIQFYSGNFLNGSFHTSEGKPIGVHSALCLETQHFPDSPNEPGFPSTILNPGEKYHSITRYKISTQ